MFETIRMKRRIRSLTAQIKELETKRTRSQSALTEALLSNKEPLDEDVDFFNKYTAHINLIRGRIRELQRKLEEGKKKK